MDRSWTGLRAWCGLAIAAFSLVTGCGGKSGPTAPTSTDAAEGDGVLGEWVSSQGIRRTYALHVPPGCGVGQPCPLLLAFHGATGSHQFPEIVGLNRAADRARFVVAAPDGVAGDWAIGCGGCTVADRSGIDDVRMTATLVSHLAQRIGIDPARVYAAGRSDGASFVYHLACLYPLAGAGVVAGTLWDGGCRPARPVPLVAFHGTADAIIPYLQGAVSAQKWASQGGCDTTPVGTPIPDRVPDGTTVTRYDFPGCAGGMEVAFFAISGGGHNWPGSPTAESAGLQTEDVSASEEIVSFFARHSAGR